MEFYQRFKTIFEGYDADVEKWKKAMMKDDLDFVNDIRNLIPDMTNFERDVKQLYEDLMAERREITLPPPLPAEDIAVDEGLAEAEIKDELQDPLPDIKEEVIQQEEKETLPTLPDEPKFVEFKDDEPMEGETPLETRSRTMSRLSEDLTALLEGDDRRQAEERNAELDRLTRQSRADLEKELALLGEKYEPPEIVEPRTDRSGLNVDEVSWAKALNFLAIETRRQESLDRVLEENRARQSQREKELKGLFRRVIALKKKNQSTESQDAELLQLQRQQEFDKQQEEEMILLQKGILSQADRDLAQGLNRLYDLATRRLDEIDDAIAEKQNAVLAVKEGKARKKQEKELRQMEEEKARVEKELVEIDNRRATIIQKLVRGQSAKEGLRKTKAEIKAEFKEIISPLTFSDIEMKIYNSRKREQLQEEHEEGQDFRLDDFFEKYPYLTDKEIKTFQEEARLRRISGEKRMAKRQADSQLEMDLLQKVEDEWVKLGKSPTDLEFVEFIGMLPMRYEVDQWANEIEDFIQAEKDRQAMEELGMDIGEQKKQFARAVAESVVLEDLVKKSALKNLGDLTEPQLEEFFKQTANDSTEERAQRLSGETTPPKRRPTPVRPRLSSRQPSMEAIVEGEEPINPLIVEKEQFTQQELNDQLEVLKRKRPRKELDKMTKKTEMDAILDVLGRKAFKPETPLTVLEQRLQTEGTAPKRPLPVPRPARTPEQRRQAAEESKASEPRVSTPLKRAPTPPTRLDTPTKARVPVKTKMPELSQVEEPRVSTPLKRAPTPPTRLDTPTKARVPVKSTFEKRIDQPVAELVKQAEAVLPELEKLSRKRPTPVRARPAEEREGEREMADALRRAEKREEERVFKVQPDDITLKAQKEAELFLAENLRRAGVSRDDVVAVKTLVEQKKKDEGFQGTIAKKKAMKSPYSSPENVAKFQAVQARLEPPRVETLLATQISRVSDAQERLRMEEEQRKMRLERELEAQKLKPNEEAKRLMEERRSTTPSSRPQTPARTQTPVQRLIQARQLVRDFASMKAELDAGVSDKDAVYAEERERYKNGTKTLNLWNSMNLTPEEQQLLGTSKDEFLGKWAEAVRKAGKGIPMKPKTFVEFGKFKLNENMLEEGVLQVKTANGSPVPAFSKKVAISDTLQTILMDLIETKKLRGVSDLDDEERRMLETLIIKAGLAHGLGVKKVHQSDEDAKKVKRFDLVKGIYEAGNNSVEVIHELRSLILYFIKTKRLNRKDGIEALQELQ
jgi:hypothetical protein